MSSPISFGGKCATVLVGAALSWATITVPEFDQAVGKLFRIDEASTSSEMPTADVAIGELQLTAPPQVTGAGTSNAEIGSRLFGLEAVAGPKSAPGPKSVSGPESTIGFDSAPPITRREFNVGSDSSLISDAKKDTTSTVSTALAAETGFSNPRSDELPRSTIIPTDSSGRRIEQITSQLKQLGASYVLLERLPQRAGDKFRARCDLAGPQNPVKCCFEAVRDSPNEALEDVLQAVSANTKRPVTPRASI